MSMHNNLSGMGLCLLSLLALSSTTVLAQQQQQQQQQQTSEAPAAAAGFGVSVAADRLQDKRGGSELMKTEMNLSGTTAQNNAEQINTGSNIISAGSFANASGLPIVIQNSGANVLIQNATILNLQLR